MYFLQSQRLGFRTWSREDLPLAEALWGDPAVTRWIGGPWDQARIRERLEQEILSMESHRLQYWPVFLLNQPEHVGCAGLRPYRPAQSIFELGVHLRPAFWGLGLAVEAARAVITHGFEALGARAVFAGHNPHNDASRRLMAKLGFPLVGEEYYPPTGLNHPSYLLTAQEYARNRSPE